MPAVCRLHYPTLCLLCSPGPCRCPIPPSECSIHGPPPVHRRRQQRRSGGCALRQASGGLLVLLVQPQRRRGAGGVCGCAGGGGGVCVWGGGGGGRAGSSLQAAPTLLPPRCSSNQAINASEALPQPLASASNGFLSLLPRRRGVLCCAGQGRHHGPALPDAARGALPLLPGSAHLHDRRDGAVRQPAVLCLACVLQDTSHLDSRCGMPVLLAAPAHPPAHPPIRCSYLSALRTCFAAGGKELVGFERYMALRKSGGNHCHLNAIAVPGASAGVGRGTRSRGVRNSSSSTVGSDRASETATPGRRPCTSSAAQSRVTAPSAAAAAAQARAAFERAAERHGFTLTFLPKLIGDAEAKEQLRGVGEHGGGGGVDHGRGSTRHAACWPSVSFLLPPTCHPCHPDSQPTCPPRSSSFSRRRRALRCAAARRGAHGAPHCLRRALSPQLWAGGACRAGGLPGAVSAAEWVCIHTVV